jgi:hypothetical protein
MGVIRVTSWGQLAMAITAGAGAHSEQWRKNLRRLRFRGLLLSPDVFQEIVALDLTASTSAALLEWWGGQVALEFRKRIQFPLDVAAHQGGQSLVDAPQVIVGTIHSVKGGQADVVYPAWEWVCIGRTARRLMRSSLSKTPSRRTERW